MKLEQAMATMAPGQLPSPLPPFHTPSGIFIPVIVKAEFVERELRQVFVIFVQADSDRLGALIEGSSLPMGMPANLNSLVHLLRLMFKARWDILEPRLTEATKKPPPSKERCAKIVSSVLADYDELIRDLASLRLSSREAFRGVFDSKFQKKIDACSREWVALTDDLRAKPSENAKKLSTSLTKLRTNNSKWMNIGAMQFTKAVASICELEK